MPASRSRSRTNLSFTPGYHCHRRRAGGHCMHEASAMLACPSTLRLLLWLSSQQQQHPATITKNPTKRAHSIQLPASRHPIAGRRQQLNASNDCVVKYAVPCHAIRAWRRHAVHHQRTSTAILPSRYTKYYYPCHARRVQPWQVENLNTCPVHRQLRAWKAGVHGPNKHISQQTGRPTNEQVGRQWGCLGCGAALCGSCAPRF